MTMPTSPPLLQAPLQAVPRDGLSVAADVSLIVVAVTIVVLAVVLAIMLVRMNKILVEVRTGVRTNLGPVSERARGIAENVEFITRTIRTDVDKLNGSVTAVTDKLKLASERMEERIEDFNALMEVVQEEAEDVFIDTAATVRGVRAGARSLTGGRSLAAEEEAMDRLEASEDGDALALAEQTPQAPEAADTAESERTRAVAAENG
jgi:hypothetical protein